MHPVYANPPLIEAICDFQFEPGQTWDWAIPGLYYTHVRDEFPDRAQQQTLHMELEAKPSQQMPTPVLSLPRIQFLRKDRSALVQVGPNVLTVNHLAPYPTWEPFREMIFRHFDLYVEIAQPNRVKRIHVRYVNKIELPIPSDGSGVKLGDYLIAVPNKPPDIREQVSQFIQRIEIPLLPKQALLVLQTGTLPPEREGYANFVLSLDVITNTDQPLALNAIRGWIEQAHEEMDMAFEASITDKARDLFGRKTHES